MRTSGAVRAGKLRARTDAKRVGETLGVAVGLGSGELLHT